MRIVSYSQNPIYQSIFKLNIISQRLQSKKKRLSLSFYHRINNYLIEFDTKILSIMNETVHSISPRTISKINTNTTLFSYYQKKANLTTVKTLYLKN